MSLLFCSPAEEYSFPFLLLFICPPKSLNFWSNTDLESFYCVSYIHRDYWCTNYKIWVVWTQQDWVKCGIKCMAKISNSDFRIKQHMGLLGRKYSHRDSKHKTSKLTLSDHLQCSHNVHTIFQAQGFASNISSSYSNVRHCMDFFF